MKRQARELVRPSVDDPPRDAVPAWVIDAFWEEFGVRLRPSAEVSVVPEAVHPRELRTAKGEPLAAPTGMTSCYVFFVDQYPEANWAHECAYAFIASNGGRGWLDAEWPPEEQIELSKVTPG